MRFSDEPLTAGLEEAMRYSLLAGGKRIRPGARAGHRPRDRHRAAEVMPLAGAIELIHTYSLIHDDLPAMDDDELRRGQPTCHVKFGEDVAILAGDGALRRGVPHLLTQQRSARPSACSRRPPSWRPRPASNGMVGGQYVDVEAGRPDGASRRCGGCTS